MISVIYSKTYSQAAIRSAALLALLALTACSSSNLPETTDPAPTGDFELRSLQQEYVLVEGDEAGLGIQLSINRQNGHASPVTLSLQGVTPADSAFVTSAFSNLTLTPTTDETQITLTLAIADLPLMPQQREFLITASDGQDSDQTRLTVNVVPVNAPDVYLLVGQSNMIGFSGDGTRQASPGGADESNSRIKQLNASKNDDNLFLQASDFTSHSINIVEPALTIAEDPLHVPLDPSNTSGKNLQYIGLGLSFAKQALNNTSKDIILVPAAWSGSAFCTNEQGPAGQWNSQPVDDSNLGNTWLFDRAVTRANIALSQTGGILRGILWHQGESDSNDRCAPLYAANLERLVKQLRMGIDQDRRGPALRQADSNIPFVVGTMSKGVDEREDLSNFYPSKLMVDEAHRNLPTQVPYVALSNHDDLVPANGYPCGNTSCIHFGALALREMGNRYYAALINAAQQ